MCSKFDVLTNFLKRLFEMNPSVSVAKVAYFSVLIDHQVNRLVFHHAIEFLFIDSCTIFIQHASVFLQNSFDLLIGGAFESGFDHKLCSILIYNIVFVVGFVRWFFDELSCLDDTYVVFIH